MSLRGTPEAKNEAERRGPNIMGGNFPELKKDTSPQTKEIRLSHKQNTEKMHKYLSSSTTMKLQNAEDRTSQRR